MIIHYCDPALTSRTGHHYQWAISYLDALKRSYDVEVHTWIGKDATPECVAALQAFGPVNLHFSLRPYSVRRFLLKDPVGGSLQFFMEGSQLLASELRRMPAADLTFWITLFPYQLHAMATAGMQAPVIAGLHAPSDDNAFHPAMWRYGARLAARTARHIRYFATIDELVPEYTELLQQEVPVMPLPVEACPAAAPRERLHCIGFFGHQLPRKGVHLLQELADVLGAKGYGLVVQDCNGSASVTGDNVRVLPFVDNLADEIARCDLVVLPYDASQYVKRASGVAWEAVSRGVPVVAPAGTAVARFLRDTGAGVQFETTTTERICAAVEEAGREYGRLAQNAFVASRDWGKTHGAERFLREAFARAGVWPRARGP